MGEETGVGCFLTHTDISVDNGWPVLPQLASRPPSFLISESPMVQASAIELLGCHLVIDNATAGPGILLSNAVIQINGWAEAVPRNRPWTLEQDCPPGTNRSTTLPANEMSSGSRMRTGDPAEKSS